MIKILDERENYLLVTDSVRYAVVERRAGKFYSLRDSERHAVALDDAGFDEIVREEGCQTEHEARHILEEVAARWRDLAEEL